MAQAPVLYDFDIALSHVERSIDARLQLRIPRHPSETMERVWLRIFARCLFHEERLEFGPGLGDPDAPDLETRDYTNRITRWIRVGKGDPLKIQRAVDQNSGASVAMLFESPARMEAFLAEAREEKASRLAKVELLAIDPDLLKELASDEGRRTKASLTLVGDHAYVDRGGKSCDGPVTRGAF
jgi:uncharacterized protein YaeQ